MNILSKKKLSGLRAGVSSLAEGFSLTKGQVRWLFAGVVSETWLNRLWGELGREKVLGADMVTREDLLAAIDRRLNEREVAVSNPA